MHGLSVGSGADMLLSNENACLCVMCVIVCLGLLKIDIYMYTVYNPYIGRAQVVRARKRSAVSSENDGTHGTHDTQTPIVCRVCRFATWHT